MAIGITPAISLTISKRDIVKLLAQALTNLAPDLANLVTNLVKPADKVTNPTTTNSKLLKGGKLEFLHSDWEGQINTIKCIFRPWFSFWSNGTFR